MEQRNTTVNMLSRPPENHSVWLDETDRIASFHEISGYQRHDYAHQSSFMAFLHSLQELGYRFR